MGFSCTPQSYIVEIGNLGPGDKIRTDGLIRTLYALKT